MKPEEIRKQIEKKDIWFKRFNQDKWMMYERDIIKYYYPQLKLWFENKNRKPAQINFTSGLGRDIARLLEEAQLQGYQEALKEVEKLIVRSKEETIKNGKRLGLLKYYEKDGSSIPICANEVLKEIQELKDEK